MKQSILITGVSGSGKSTLGSKLREMGYIAHDIESISGMFTTTDTRTGAILTEWDPNNLEDMKNLRFACNKGVLDNLIEQEQSEIAFYCGVATNIEEILPSFTKIIVLQASPDAVQHRLSTRTTHDFARTPEMQQWILEIKGPFEKTLLEYGAVAINADGDVDDTAQKVLKS